jgi:von Willebrand factor type A domain/Aerotolerance regulator N-terminal
MFLVNLGLGQFLAIFGAISAVSVLLYLLDRSRRRVVVSTLRFWVAAEQPTAVVRRKQISQPFSLFLQLLSMLLLLLALAQLRIGSQANQSHQHVLILETSAWMNARIPGRRTLMDSARDRARAYVRALPSNDQVMLVRADALATPATAFESNHAKVLAAITESVPGSTSLNIHQALSFARQVQGNSGRLGEVVFVGSGRVSEADATESSDIKNLRVLTVADPVENTGLRKIGIKRSNTNPEAWDIFVSARNYGSRSKEVILTLTLGGLPAGSQRLVLPAGEEKEATFSYRTRAAGVLQARLTPGDAFPDDDRASIELPPLATLPVVVYSNQPELLRPFFDANPQVLAVFKPVSQFVNNDKGLVVIDRFHPASRPQADTIWIDPPADSPPLPIKERVQKPETIRWDSENALGAGLRTRDVHIDSTSVFNTAPGDIKVAEIEAGPIIVARPGSQKTLVFGFHPALTSMRYELATPLLFANSLRWFAPEVFHSKELSTQPVGTVNVAVDSTIETQTSRAGLRVVREDGTPIPFTVQGKSLHFYSGNPGIARVINGDRESIYSLSLPEMGETKWKPPADAKRGLPSFRESVQSVHDTWRVFAILGGLGLLIEWLMYGRFERVMVHARNLLRWPGGLRKAS